MVRARRHFIHAAAACVAAIFVLQAGGAHAENGGQKRSAALAAALGLGFKPDVAPTDAPRATGLPGVGAKAPPPGKNCSTERVRSFDANTRTTGTVQKQRVCL